VAAPEPELEIPSEEELLSQIRRLSRSTDYLTLRKILRALIPQESAGDERLRGAIADRVQGLIDGGALRPDRRTVKGRTVNTLVLSHEADPAQESDGSDAAEANTAKPPARRRVRGKAGASAAS
jgi:hypothetical protein